MRISRARGSNQGTRLIRTKIVLLGRAHYYSYVSRFTLRVCDRSANTAPNSEVHPKATLAVDGILAEALQTVEDGDTRVLENVSAAAIDPKPAERPQHKRRRGYPLQTPSRRVSSPTLTKGLSPPCGGGTAPLPPPSFFRPCDSLNAPRFRHLRHAFGPSAAPRAYPRTFSCPISRSFSSAERPCANPIPNSEPPPAPGLAPSPDPLSGPGPAPGPGSASALGPAPLSAGGALHPALR